MKIRKLLSNCYRTLTKSSRMLDELYWAEIYNSTTSNSTWLTENNFSPGRWAVGYPFLYAMYRILNEKRPVEVLELGLGQTTKMIGQYAKSNPTIQHTIIEEDKEWISFFNNIFSLPENSNIIQHDYEYIKFKNGKNVRIFSNFQEHIQNKKFDFIMVDAPIGSEVFSRIDILKILPQCLSDSFVIMIDDYERDGEQNTVRELCCILEEHQISYATGVYHGEKDVIVIASLDNKFFCSM